MFAVALVVGRRAGNKSPSKIIRWGFLLLAVGVAILIPIVPRAHSGSWMVIPLLIAGTGLGLLVSQLNNYTLAPIEPERVSEAAGVNSAGGSFGLSFGLAFAGAIMLASLSLLFTNEANASKVLSSRHAASGPGRNPAHQHEGAAAGAPDRAAHPAARGAARPVKRLSDDAAAGPGAVRRSRGHPRRLTAALCESAERA
jgi:hypothetical protein